MNKQQPIEEQAMMEEQPVEEKQMESEIGMDDFEKMGLPTGDDKESIKARMLKVLEDAGVLEALDTPADKQEFTVNLDKLVDAIMNKDVEAMKANPINAMLEQIMGSPQGMPQQGMPQQGMQAQGGPKDFASMIPPTGGGMNGR